MLKILFACALFLNTYMAYAISTSDMPHSFALKQIKCTTGEHCMAVMNKEQIIGTLQPAFDKSHVFYFFDAENHRVAAIKMLNTRSSIRNCGMNYCPIFQDFEIFEKNNHLVAKLELAYDVMQSSFDAFRLYTKDGKHLLISGSHTHVTGTNSVMYNGLDPDAHKLALITRPLFTLSLDSDVTILDRTGLLFTIDPNIFAATLAIYCNTSLFYDKPKEGLEQNLSLEASRRLRKKLQDLAETEGLLDDIHAHVSDQAIKAAGNTLTKLYQQTYGDFWDDESLFTKEKKLQQLIDLGADLILSHTLSLTEEKAMLQFLVTQLYINQ